MISYVTISLTYKLTGDNPSAIDDAEQSLLHTFAPGQGRVEELGGAGVHGSYSAICTSKKAEVER